jgi:hypothetical protein
MPLLKSIYVEVEHQESAEPELQSVAALAPQKCYGS